MLAQLHTCILREASMHGIDTEASTAPAGALAAAVCRLPLTQLGTPEKLVSLSGSVSSAVVAERRPQFHPSRIDPETCILRKSCAQTAEPQAVQSTPPSSSRRLRIALAFVASPQGLLGD